MPDLIWFSVVAFTLQIDLLFDSLLAKNMMASTNAHDKTCSLKEIT
ncbi:MAG: hypothetical protein J0648_08515 [Pelodictyon phaeoclathratiforme]|nr:hypothetical protein [Pelodictyon phaeoclathratiforme]